MLEALEALRLLDAGVAAGLVPSIIEQQALERYESPTADPTAHLVWDEALGQSSVSDLLEADHEPALRLETSARQVGLGLAQLDRYLGRAWSRAGIAPQHFEDCTQSVYLTLIENNGAPAFESMARDIAGHGIPRVLNADTLLGPDFFRAVDMVKKRAQRVRSHQSIDEHLSQLMDGPSERLERDAWLQALNEVVERSLTPREAALVNATLEGKAPAEIAREWGLTAKTVSNEKSRVLQKLRLHLSADLAA